MDWYEPILSDDLPLWLSRYVIEPSLEIIEDVPEQERPLEVRGAGLPPIHAAESVRGPQILKG